MQIWATESGTARGGLKPRDGYRENYMHASLRSHSTRRVQRQLGNRETSIGNEQSKVFFLQRGERVAIHNYETKGKVGGAAKFT